jgi:hypothetical protein
LQTNAFPLGYSAVAGYARILRCELRAGGC